jgi:predicted GTPase
MRKIVFHLLSNIICISALIQILPFDFFIQVLDELEPLENAVLRHFSNLCPECDLAACSPEDVKAAVAAGFLSDEARFQGLKKFFRDIPSIPQKLCLVGRIHLIRLFLQKQFMIAFVGVHNAGKSTLINKMFDFDTGADLVVRTELPKQYLFGNWMRCARKNPVFEDWQTSRDKEDLQVCQYCTMLLLV